MAASPGIVPLPRRLWHAVKYVRAERVCDREELNRALARAPAYIIVEGNEALRAYAAGLAERGGQQAARLDSDAAEATSGYVAGPVLGRIRDGYRRALPGGRRPGGQRRRWWTLEPGVGAVLAACVGLLAALAVEWLAWPSTGLDLVRHPHRAASAPLSDGAVALPTHAPPSSTGQLLGLAVPLLAGLAAAALLVLLVLAVGPGRKRRVDWRIDYRVQGLLVIARVRTQVV